ncbi:helix-turn-helix domain-containing protein [Enterococcus sp. AZ072]|uniref:helix-turn-helix domain-containing protein n=1 Tax=unclassified Enterococcus TaxID=2608891 RepID=UPI003D26E5B5
MDNFTSLVPLILRAQEGDEESMSELIATFDNLLKKLSRNDNGSIDEDCYQTLAERFIKAVKKFDAN